MRVHLFIKLSDGSYVALCDECLKELLGDDKDRKHRERDTGSVYFDGRSWMAAWHDTDGRLKRKRFAGSKNDLAAKAAAVSWLNQHNAESEG